jgi:hypothetical protein
VESESRLLAMTMVVLAWLEAGGNITASIGGGGGNTSASSSEGGDNCCDGCCE